MTEIFALDIGTRKVMGIIARQLPDCLEVLDVEVIEHQSRPMFDGQIHSIDEVVKTVQKIKENLESRLNKKLEKVGVAVAGRSLITFREKVTRDLDQPREVDSQLVRDLELEAVDKIISDSGRNPEQFHCVGYSPVYYELNGTRISNLIGHQAKQVSVEVIITFLPRIVLDSIFVVLQKTGLELVNLTLEPIAAINAIIPQDMRHLNILLVDVGAGTSDLALTKEGVVFAYGMVPEAGDEITEAICENLIVDFNAAERIKRILLTSLEIKYQDIWGKKHVVKSQKIRQAILPRVGKLADSIVKLAMELNGGKPQAVVGVGGGSQTSDLINQLAASFSITTDKVGIRGPSAVTAIKDTTGRLTGPDSITPMGIAMMTASSSGLSFMNIEVNNRKLKMLDFYQKKDILGVIILSGVNNKRLHPRPGAALTVKLNGELKIIKGTMGVSAELKLNGQSVSSLSCKVKSDDVIEFREAVDGKDAEAVIADIVEIKPKQISFNQEQVTIAPAVTMNKQDVDSSTPIVDRALIEIVDLTIKDVLTYKGMNLSALSERQILVNINNQPQILTQRNFTLSLNNKTAGMEAAVQEGDRIGFSSESPTFYKIKDVVEGVSNTELIHINVDGKEVEIILAPVEVYMNGKRVKPDEFLIDGADIKVYHIRERKVLLSEIFRYINVDPEMIKGKKIKILVNEQPAGFTTPLAEGAQVRIIFEDLT